MRSIKFLSAALLVAGLVSTPTAAHAQGKVIASNDEWFTSTLGSTGADDRKFLTNALNWFGVSAGNSILLFSDNPMLTNSGFTDFLTSMGLNVVVNSTETNFSPYAAVFVEANKKAGKLASYVSGGGNVFDIAGTGGLGGATLEAAFNSAFLYNYGLGLAPVYSNVNGNVNTSSFAGQGVFGDALFNGVNSVFVDNGNDIVFNGPVDGVTTQVFSVDGHAVYAAAQLTATPEPASVALMATGLLGLIPVIRRRRRQS